MIVLLEMDDRSVACSSCGRELECGSCGGTNVRPNMALADRLRRRVGEIGSKPASGWIQQLPLDLLYDFNESELDLLRDLNDYGGTLNTRRPDGRYESLRQKNAVSVGATSDRCYVKISKRGYDLLERL